MKHIILLSLLLSLINGGLSAQKKEKFFNLIPYPTELKQGKGEFVINRKTVITADAEVTPIANFLGEVLSTATKTKIAVIQNTKKTNSIAFIVSDEKELGPQGYRLEITTDNITIHALKPEGFFMAIATIRQLLPFETKKVSLPALTIKDKPEFIWRGMMLDVGRHFFPKDFVKRYIDLISFYKFTELHWHLTDDQGWRIEIKKYPKLTEVGAWRTEADGTRYGGFYTQDDVREIVAYALKRGITIVPEIEMPGHSTAALAAYPWLSCTGGPFTVATGWGVFEDVYCAGKESTFTFMENVLTEVLDLFPSKYIHIGGDECPKTRWSKCPDCQKRIKDEGLKDEAQLQSYFIHRIEKFLHEKGRSLTGWDEILEGGIAPSATIQLWRDWKYAKEAAETGHDVIMSPTSHSYFDYPPEGLTLEKVYTFYPMPDNFPEELKSHILGGECNLWTENVTNGDKVDFMMFPRILAMSECMWNGKSRQPYADFHKRVQTEYTRLQHLGIKYGPEGPVYTVKFDYDKSTSEFIAMVNQLSKGFEYRYTLDGGEPSLTSQKVVNDEVRFKGPLRFRLQSFLNGYPNGSPTDRNFVVHKALGATVTMVNPVSTYYPGLGSNNLCDGMMGSTNIKDGFWQAISYKDMIAIVDMGEAKQVNEVSLDMLSAAGSWILFPYGVFFEVSDNGKDFKGIGSIQNDLPIKTLETMTKAFTVKLKEPITTRYIKVTAKNSGLLPEWHQSKGEGAWIFFDELIVK